MLTPMIWLIAATSKGPDDLFHYLFFAPRLAAYNYVQLFEQIPYLRFMVNSFFVAGATVLVQLFFSSLGGFALAKYEFRFKKLVMDFVNSADSVQSWFPLQGARKAEKTEAISGTFFCITLPMP